MMMMMCVCVCVCYDADGVFTDLLEARSSVDVLDTVEQSTGAVTSTRLLETQNQSISTPSHCCMLNDPFTSLNSPRRSAIPHVHHFLFFFSLYGGLFIVNQNFHDVRDAFPWLTGKDNLILFVTSHRSPLMTASAKQIHQFSSFQSFLIYQRTYHSINLRVIYYARHSL